MQVSTTTTLSYINYYQAIRGTRNSEWQKKWKIRTSKLHKVKLRNKEWETIQQLKTIWGQIKDTSYCTHKVDSQAFNIKKCPTGNAQKCNFRNQRLVVKYCLEECPQWGDSKRKFYIHGNIGDLLGKNCEVGKLIIFVKKTGLFEDMQELNCGDENEG